MNNHPYTTVMAYDKIKAMQDGILLKIPRHVISMADAKEWLDSLGDVPDTIRRNTLARVYKRRQKQRAQVRQWLQE